MARPGSREGAYTWSATISNAIKAADPTRPVISGMHSLSIEGELVNYSGEMVLDGKNIPWSANRRVKLKTVIADVLAKKNVLKGHSKAGITENGNIVTVVNYSNQPIDPQITLQNGKQVDKIYHGKLDMIDACDALVFSIK